MKELLEYVIDDLAAGHIDAAEAKKRVESILCACKQYPYYMLQSYPVYKQGPTWPYLSCDDKRTFSKSQRL